MSIIRSMIKTRRCFSLKQKFRERDEKPTNFPLLLLLCLSFYVVDRQPTTKEEREILSSSSSSLSLSLFLPFTDERSKRSQEDDKREAAAFRTKPSRIILKVRSSSEERSNFILPRRVVRCFRSQRSPPFPLSSSSSSNVMK